MVRAEDSAPERAQGPERARVPALEQVRAPALG